VDDYFAFIITGIFKVASARAELRRRRLAACAQQQGQQEQQGGEKGEEEEEEGEEEAARQSKQLGVKQAATEYARR
jgi:hypothetical protein